MKKLFLIYLQILFINIYFNLYANANDRNRSLLNLENKEYEYNINKSNSPSQIEYILDDVNINKSNISKNNILNILNLKIGEKIYINNAKYNDLFNRLWESDLFDEDIGIQFFKKDKNRVYINLNIKDLPKIYSLNVFGIKKEIFNKIAENYNIKLGGTISDRILYKIKKDINKYYNKNGYPNVYVIFKIKNITVDNNYDDNISLYINVNKRNNVEINKIFFEGNNNFSFLDFNEIVSYPKGNNPLLFKIKRHYNNILDKYKTRGFRDARILTNILSKDNNLNILTIKLYEGNPFFLGKFNISGNKLFDENFFSKITKFSPKNPYDLKKFYKNILDENDNNSLLSYYIDHGYVNTNITANESEIEKDKVNIDVNISEGDQAIVNNVNYSENKITNDNIVSKYSDTYTGDQFSRKNIKETVVTLGKSGIFNRNKISVEIKSNKRGSSTLDIMYKVLEINSNKIQLQGGYGDKKIFGNISLHLNNFSSKKIFNFLQGGSFPQGDGEKLSLFTQVSYNDKSYGFSLKKPFLFNDKLANFNLKSSYAINKENNKSVKSRVRTYSTYLGIDKLFNWNNKMFLFNLYNSLDVYIRNNTNIGFYEIPLNGISNDINYNIGLEHNSIKSDDNYQLNGLFFNIKGKFTIPYSSIFRNNDKYTWPEYYKLTSKIYSYKEITDKLVMKTGGEVGYIGYYNSFYGPSAFQRFYLGGTSNSDESQAKQFIPLRGYYEYTRYPSITTEEGGEIYSRILTELRYPIFKNAKIKSWILGFFEAGGILSNANMINNFSLKKTLGTGIRFSINNLGVLGFDLGYGLENNIYNNKSIISTHFVIGNDI